MSKVISKSNSISDMADWSEREGNFLVIFEFTTFLLLIIVIISAFWSSNLKLYAELDVIILALISYTLILVLPITDFDLSLTGLKAKLLRRKLNELSNEADTKKLTKPSLHIEEKLNADSISPTDVDLVFMSLIIEIQQTLDEIASNVGIQTRKNSLGELIHELKIKGILTEPWLLRSLYFLRDSRNEVLHLGNRKDITTRAINVEKSVLIELLEIKKKLKKNPQGE